MRGVKRANSAPDEAAGARGRWLPGPSSPARLSPAELPALLSRGQWMHTHLPAHLCCTPWAPTHPSCARDTEDTAARTSSRRSRCGCWAERTARRPLKDKRVCKDWQAKSAGTGNTSVGHPARVSACMTLAHAIFTGVYHSSKSKSWAARMWPKRQSRGWEGRGKYPPETVDY